MTTEIFCPSTEQLPERSVARHDVKLFLVTRVRCVEENADVLGAWSAMISREIESPDATFQRTCLTIGGRESCASSPRVRISALIESLKWIVNPDAAEQPEVKLNLVSSDVFLVNLLREWLPRWKKRKFKMRGGVPRPARELLVELDRYLQCLKIMVIWQPDKSLHLNELGRQAEEALEIKS